MSKARNLSKLLPDANGALPSSNIGADSITSDKIAADSVSDSELTAGAAVANIGYTPANQASLGTLSTISPTGTANSSTFLRGDNSWQVVAVTPTAVSDQNNTSTGYFDLPSGTTAQRPGSPAAGYTRYNTTLGSIEFYNGTSWISTNLIPIVNSVTGNIYSGASSTLTISLSNSTDVITVRFREGGTLLADVTSVTVTGGSATVTVPSAVYGQAVGDVITVSTVNADGTESSNSVNKTVGSLPTGGTITTSGANRIHTFTSSGTFTVPSGFSATASYLVVAGAGGGGGNRGGGGGAGGMLTGSTSISANSYSITVGSGGSAGGAGVAGGDGNNSSALGVTAIGGGSGGANSRGNGNPGGSGGAGGSLSGASGGSGTSGQGNAGGSTGGNVGGSGGGKGGAGLNGDGSQRPGGAGEASSISGSSVTYSTGGHAGCGSDGCGVGANGAANTGNGGGGGGGEQSGGSGGSGIVIISYAL